jgi:hypothetical protein
MPSLERWGDRATSVIIWTVLAVTLGPALVFNLAGALLLVWLAITNPVIQGFIALYAVIALAIQAHKRLSAP